MFPTLSGTNRTNNRDIELGGYKIPKNTMIWCNINAIFRDPNLWEDPDRYWPVSEPVKCTHGIKSLPGFADTEPHS